MNTHRDAFSQFITIVVMAAALFVMWLALLALWPVRPAHAQPSWQQNSVPYCPTGLFDPNNNPIVMPCGGPNTPGMTVIETQHPTQPYPTVQCPPNPISKKIPPLC